VKAASTIVELSETAPPIFGDPDRDYDYLALLKSYVEVPGGIEILAETYEGSEANVRYQFVAPGVVRVQYVPSRAPETTPMLDGPLPPPPDVSVAEEDGAIEISSASLRLRIERQPLRWLLIDGDGRVVAAQEVHDGMLDRYVSFPGGWSHLKGVQALHETLSLRADEQLYGLGESFAQLNRRGSRVTHWSRDTYGTNTTPLTYMAVPFWLSTRGYGVFVNHTSRAVYEMGAPSQLACSFRVEDPYLDYFVIHGPRMRDVLERYWGLTGQGTVPPLWSFGVWMSRCMYRDAEQVRDVVERLRALDIPLDVVNIDPRWLEGRKHHERDACDFVWDERAFGTPEEFLGWLGEHHVRLCLWENPYVWRDTEMYQEGFERGYFATDENGEPIATLDNAREAVVVDFTNPDAARWWQDKHRPYLRAGVSAFKTDYGEGVPANARFSNGTTGIETHNVYPLLYNRAVFEVIEEERGEAIVFGRSGYAGSQRYPLNWVGDTQCTWDAMAAALRAGLSLSLSGIPFWSHDIGGFWNNVNLARGPDPELYIRWAQWGLLSSHSRFHGVRGREPWWYGEEAIETVRRFAQIRYRLLPYLWSSANQSVERSLPLVRPMVLEFPDDPTCQHIDSQYMLGPSLLVAPVFEPGGRVRVYLPAGRWHDFWTEETVEGPCWREVTMPLDRLPVYVRDDSLLPFAPEMTYVGERAWDPLEVAVRVSTEASLRVQGEGVGLAIEARRENGGLALELEGRASLKLRFLAPDVREATVSGDAEDVRQERENGSMTLSLRLDGSARVALR